MPVKTYVLLDALDAQAPIYQQTPDGRSQIKKIPRHRPYLKVTFQNSDGVNKTIRFKASSNTVFMDEQIKNENIAANEKFTQTERDMLYFKYGILTTDKVVLQQFLEAHPEYDKFNGSCEEVKSPCYKLLDKAAEGKLKNAEIRKRVEAAQVIMSLDLEKAQDLMIRINGSHFQVPSEIEECQNALMQFLDDTNEDGLNEILKKETTVDDDAKLLVGKLINAKLLDFDNTTGNVSKKTVDGSGWVVVKQFSLDYPLEERVNMFADFLSGDSGKLLRADLEKSIETHKKPKGEASKNKP